MGQILEVKLTPWRKPLKRQVMRPELMELLDKLTKEQHAEYQTKVKRRIMTQTDVVPNSHGAQHSPPLSGNGKCGGVV